MYMLNLYKNSAEKEVYGYFKWVLQSANQIPRPLNLRDAIYDQPTLLHRCSYDNKFKISIDKVLSSVEERTYLYRLATCPKHRNRIYSHVRLSMYARRLREKKCEQLKIKMSVRKIQHRFLEAYY